MKELPLGVQSIPLARGGEELVVIEEGLSLELHGTSLLTMRTPQGEESDLDWTIGFLTSEGVIHSPDDIKHLEYVEKGEVPPENASMVAIAEVRVELHRPSYSDRLGTLSRTIEMRPGCGVCGVATPEALVGSMPVRSQNGQVWSLEELAHLVPQLHDAQVLFPLTGGCHGCAFFTLNGEMLSVAEDVGRHNALDKAAGSVLRRGGTLASSICVLSGRSGYELVLKAAKLGCSAVVSVGAASSFSVEIARAAKMALVGFVSLSAEGELRRAHVYADGEGFVVA